MKSWLLRKDISMARMIGTKLSEDLGRRLDGHSVSDFADQAILLHTIDADGFPHPCVLSYFEVVAADIHNIHLATYKESQTTQNMRQRSKVTLSIFDTRVTYYLKGSARELRQEMRSAPHNSMINVSLEQVLSDQADPVLEPGAYIERGIIVVNPHVAREPARYEAILKELLA